VQSWAQTWDVLDRISDAVFILDGDLRVRHANPAALLLLGVDAQVVDSQPLELFVSHHKIFLSSVLEPFRSNHAAENVEVCIQSQGKDAHGLLSAGHLSGPEMEWVVIVKDISKLKNDQNKTTERHLEMAKNSRLESIGTLAGGVAHEINNPLAIILGYAQKLARIAPNRDSTPEMLTELSEKIQVTALRIGKIVGSLRMLAKDGDDEAFELIHARDAVLGTLELLRTKAETDGIEFRMKFHEDESLIRARPSQISQVCLHLLANAIDALDGAKEKWIQIETQDSEDFVELAFVDSGPGIPADIRDQIMLPFFTTKDPGLGTGLGLSIGLRVAREHGGDLYLDSRSPHTRFVVRFPKQKQSISLMSLGKSD